MAGSAQDWALKFHASLNVSDLTRSIGFYRVLLGVAPEKVREDYAKFELTEPPLVLSLIPGRPGGNLNHVGLRVRNTEELVDVQRRLETAGIVTRREDGVECCYARQTKFWVADPDRMLWEIYVFHEDIDERGEGTVPVAAIGQFSEVSSVSKPPATWGHRLGDSFPDRIPHEANSLHEVTLEGSLNARRDASNRDKLIGEALRVLRPGGAVEFHGLAGDYPGNGEKPGLSGPAAAVDYVPTAFEVATEFAEAGFVDVHIEMLSERAYFVVSGVPMRELRIRARKPGHRPKQKTHHAIYRGPHAEVTDDYGNVFRRGERTSLNVHDWQMLSKGPAAAGFIFLAPDEKPDGKTVERTDGKTDGKPEAVGSKNADAQPGAQFR